MAHFYGTLQGARGEVSRCGTKTSGLTTTNASWNGAVTTHIFYDPAIDKNRYIIKQIPWHGAGITKVLSEGILGE